MSFFLTQLGRFLYVVIQEWRAKRALRRAEAARERSRRYAAEVQRIADAVATRSAQW